MPECVEEGCTSTKIVGRKRCTRHYQQWRKDNAPQCIEDGCEDPAQARERCPKHYQRWRATREQPATEPPPPGIWAWVPDFEGYYQACEDGRIWSYPRATTPGGLLDPTPDPHGYPQVTFSVNGVHTYIRVHNVILRTFRGPCPPGKEGAHDDGNPWNNNIRNLWYKTRGENIADQVRHGTHPHASKVHCRWGHEYAGDNLRIDKDGHRFCKTCDRSRSCRDPQCTRPNHDHVNTPWPAGAALVGSPEGY